MTPYKRGKSASVCRLVESDLWLAGANVQKPTKKFPQGLEMGKSVEVFTKDPSI